MSTKLTPSNSSVGRDSYLEEARLKRIESDKRLQYSVDYTQAGLRGLFIANGGAILSLLTFIGNSNRVVGSNGMFWSFVWFGIGLSACLATYFFAGNSQDHLMNATYNEAHQAIADAESTEEKFDVIGWENKAKSAFAFGGALSAVSLGAFIIGAFTALVAIT